MYTVSTKKKNCILFRSLVFLSSAIWMNHWGNVIQREQRQDTFPLVVFDVLYYLLQSNWPSFYIVYNIIHFLFLLLVVVMYTQRI